MAIPAWPDPSGQMEHFSQQAVLQQQGWQARHTRPTQQNQYLLSQTGRRGLSWQQGHADRLDPTSGWSPSKRRPGQVASIPGQQRGPSSSSQVSLGRQEQVSFDKPSPATPGPEHSRPENSRPANSRPANSRPENSRPENTGSEKSGLKGSGLRRPGPQNERKAGRPRSAGQSPLSKLTPARSHWQSGRGGEGEVSAADAPVIRRLELPPRAANTPRHRGWSRPAW